MALPPDALPKQVQNTIQALNMFSGGARILVAVSGGADSVALLHVLHKLHYPLEVAHMDHQTRADESRADAEFVRRMAGDLGAPFHSESRPVTAESATSRLSFEEYARDVRYAFFRRVARERGCRILATGHHADDQAETVLMRLLRGAGPAGLAGIPPVRVEEGLRIVRPLIECRHGTICAWLQDHGIPWREDRSNMDEQFLRNRVRNELLPRLRQDYNPKVIEALLRLAEAQRLENDLLNEMTGEALERCVQTGGVDRKIFRELHEALRRRCLLEYALRQGVNCPFERIAAAAAFVASAPTGQYFDLGGGVSLYNGRTHTEVLTKSPAPRPEAVRLKVPGTTEALGRRFSARLLMGRPPGSLAEYCTPTRQVFDADTMADGVWVRVRQEGDRLVPLGMNQARKLSDYFTDIGLPAPQRDRHPLVIAGPHIAWVVGYASSALTAVTPFTRRMLEIEVIPGEQGESSCDSPEKR